MKTIDVGNEFSQRLANRDKFQGDGRFTAEEFRKKYLSFLDNDSVWSGNECLIVLDFKNVKRIGPSFANEAFAYFTKYSTPEKIKTIIRFENLSYVQNYVIDTELKSGVADVTITL